MTGAPRSWAASRSFIQIHYDLLDALGGSYAAAALWERIRYRSERDGWWQATRAQMCAETRLGTGALRNALEKLRAAGLIEAEKVTPFQPDLRWRVLWADETAGQAESAETATTPLVESDPMAETAITLSAETAISLSSETSREELPPSTPQTPEAGEEQAELPLLSVVAADEQTGLDEEFEGFWRAYPRKVGKRAARRAYGAARKRATLEEIAAGLVAQVPELRSRQIGMVPHPTTWLNQDRWADDPAHVAHASGAAEQPRNPFLRMLQDDAAAGLLDHYRANEPRSIG